MGKKNAHEPGSEAAGSARPSRATVLTTPRALPSDRSGCRRRHRRIVVAIEGPIESMLIHHKTWRHRRHATRHPLPRPLLVLTGTCSRVCSPSRLPRRRFTAPVCLVRA